jgi:hypothetical protein
MQREAPRGRSTAVDGPASDFLFASSSDNDARLRFDSRLGLGLDGSAAPNGIAVYKFDSFKLAGAPTVNTAGGPADLALVGVKGLSVGTTAFTWNVDNLRTVFIGSETKGFTLSDKMAITAASGSGFQSLHFYGRGGDLTLGGTYTLPTARVIADSTNNAIIASTGRVTAGEFLMNGIASAQILGNVTAEFGQVWSNGQITVGGTVVTTTLYTKSNKMVVSGGSITADKLSIETTSDFQAGAAGTVVKTNDSLDLKVGGKLTFNTASTSTTRFDISNTKSLRVEAKGLTVSQDLALSSGTTGTLKGGAEGVNATGFDLTGFEQVTTNGGDIKAKNFDARYISTISGNVNVTGDLTTLNANVDGDIKVGGMIKQRAGTTPDTLHSLSGKSIAAAGGLNFAGANAGSLLATPTHGGTVVLNSTEKDIKFDTGADAINGANLDGGSAASLTDLTEGGDGGTLHVGTDAQPTKGNIIVNAPISATTGANGNLATTGGKGGTVSMVSAKRIDVQSTIKVSDSAPGRASKQGGNIRLESRATGGAAINVSNSGELLSLLNAAAPGPGGKIEFVSAGGDIKVNGGTLQADKGVVNIVNNGAGNITLANATLRGDVVKANVVGANGQLIIGGGSIDANSAIKLYASGANGKVVFNDNVSLNGNSVKSIAGNSVTINDGKVVTINGPSAASVYTNNANYTGSGGNGSKSGTFGGKGATTQPFANRPAY